MTTINLKEFFYWYITDESIVVPTRWRRCSAPTSGMRSGNYERRKRNKAQYSLDAGDGIENHIVEFELSAQEILERKERFCHLCRALNSLPEAQGQRIDAHILLGKPLREIAAEGLSINAVSLSIKYGLESMKKYLKNF